MVQIQITDNNTLVGTLEINDSATFPLAINRSLVDYRDITKRGGTYSTNFRITASANNNRVLKFIYNANSDGQFSRDCRVYVNGLQFLVGKIKVLNIYNQHGPEEYELALFSETVDWYILLQSKTIRDYDYGHPFIPSRTILANGNTAPNTPAQTALSNFNYNVVEASWFGSVADGWDYVYDLKSYGQPDNGNYMALEDMRPSLYVASILNKAFEDIGYTLQSDFFTTGIGSKLIIPFMGDNWVTGNEAVRTLNSFNVGNDFEIIADTIKGQITNLVRTETDTPLPYFDNNNVWDTANRRGVIKYAGYYSFSYDYTWGYSSCYQQPNALYTLNIRETSFQVYKNGALLYTSFAQSFTGVKQTPFNPWYDVRYNGTTPEYYLEVGDVIEVYIYHDLTSFDSVARESKLYIRSYAGNTFSNTVIARIAPNQDYEVSNVFPSYYVKDILRGLSNMFNLYFVTDPETNTVTIEPRPVYYGNKQPIDWSSKLDVNNRITTTNIDSYARNIQFRFATDGADGYVKQRDAEQNTLLGSFLLDLGANYEKGISNLGTDFFSPTINQSNHPFSDEGIIIPCFWGQPVNNPPKQYDFAPRILYYAGWVTQYLSDTNSTEIARWYWGGRPASGTGSRQDELPMSFQIDNSANETWLGTPRINLYYNGTGGLVDTYYTPDIAIIRDKRIVTAYFDLSTTDLLQIDFSKPIYIDHELYRGEWLINALKNYQPTKDTVTQLELVKNLKYSQLNFSLEVEVPLVTGLKTSLGGGTLINGQTLSNESAVLHNGSGNVGMANGGGVVMGRGLLQSQPNQHLFGNYNAPSDSIWVVGAGTLLERYNALQFTSDGQLLEQGGEVMVETNIGIIPVMFEAAFNGDKVTRYQNVLLIAE